MTDIHSISWTLVLPFVVYFIGMIGIGWFFYFRTRNLSDYVLGGRRLNSWVTSLSAQASDMSGWLLLGLPGYAYIAGMEAVWIAAGLIAGTYLNWKFVAPRLRQQTEKWGDAITLPDFFCNRFSVKTPALRLLSALFIFVFFLIYTSSGFVAGAKLFGSIFGLSYIQALCIGVIIIISYIFLGGFLAVCWTDFIQGSIMFIAIIVVPFLVMHASGGPGATLNELNQINPHLLNPMTDQYGASLSALTIFSLAAWGLGYFGQPHIMARFMAIRQVQEISKARKIAMGWVVACLTGAVLIGLFANAYFIEALPEALSETVFLKLMQSRLVPSMIAGCLLAAVLAAIMSTADSQLLVASSTFTEDIYRFFFRKKAGQKELIWIGRLSVIAIAVIAFFIAMNPEATVLDLVAYAWAGFGAAFGPVILLSLFWKGVRERGVIAGIVTGGITVIIWKHLQGGWFDLYEILPGFLLSGIAVVVFSATKTIDKKSRSLSGR